MFCLWVETTEKKRFRKPNQRHPRQLMGDDLATLLTNELGVKPPNYRRLEDLIQPRFFLLPTVEGQPLPSLELSRYLEEELPETFDFEYWQIDCYPTLVSTKTSSYGQSTVNSVVPLLNDLHFIVMHNLTEMQLGADLLFWFHFTQTLKRIIFKDQFIPSLKYRELAAPQAAHSKRKTKTGGNAKFEIYPGWEFIGEEYETALQQYVDYMPLICAAGFAEASKTLEFYDRPSLLRHFADCLLTDIVTHTYTTQGYEKTIADSVIYACLKQANGGTYWTFDDRLEQFKQWQAWRDRIVRTQTDQPFYLYFHLQDPVKPEEPWQLQFQVAPKHDPSLKVSLDDYWRMRPQQQKQVKAQLGDKFEHNL